MDLCKNHDHTVVVFDEFVNTKGCPLCELEKAFKALVEKFDKLEKENAECMKKIDYLNQRMIDVV